MEWGERKAGEKGGTSPPGPPGILGGMTPASNGGGKRERVVVGESCLEKRSPALRGRNRMRDIQADPAGRDQWRRWPRGGLSLGGRIYLEPLDAGVRP